jgi:uncharacterized membrane protein/thiol-disulfide isomerase/thioredoxin
MRRNLYLLPALLIFLTLIVPSKARAQSPEPVVHAILFYSPSCPHCHQVIQEDLPPLFEKYGKQLDMIGVDVSQPGGQALYQAAIQHFSIPENRLGVPTLIIDDIILVGSLEIPELFPGLIEQYLAQGGVDWPDIPGLREALPPTPEVEESVATVPPPTVVDPPTANNPSQSTALQSTPVSATVSPTSVSPTPTPGLILTGDEHSNWRDKLARDPAGNTLAIFVLVGMLAAILWGVVKFPNQAGISLKGNWAWLIPAICVVGFGVAGYLAYVETAQVEAVCGPVGDCNTVQQSEYARLFGILPIGILGLVGYIAIAAAWGIARFSNGWLANLAALALFAMTVFGVLFSIYLTFLEPFVIGATCAWCLTSAILMTILMLLSVRPAKLSISKISLSRSPRREHAQIGINDD